MRVKNKIFVDTLFVVALINQRDQYHQQASELADSLEIHPLITTDAVLLEIGNALARNYKDEAVEIIEHFLTSNEVEIVRLTPELFTFEECDRVLGLWSCAIAEMPSTPSFTEEIVLV